MNSVSFRDATFVLARWEIELLLVRDVGGLRLDFFVHKLSIFLGIGDFASKVVCYTNLSEGWKLQTERKKQCFVKSYVTLRSKDCLILP